MGMHELNKPIPWGYKTPLYEMWGFVKSRLHGIVRRVVEVSSTEDKRALGAYTILTLGYLAVTLSIYPVAWVSLMSLLAFPLWVNRISPLSLLVLYPLPFLFCEKDVATDYLLKLLHYPALLMGGLGTSGLKYLAMALALGLAWLLGMREEKRVRDDKTPKGKRGWSKLVLVALASVAMGGVLAMSGLGRHGNFRSWASDLGVMDNVFANMARGHGQANPLEDPGRIATTPNVTDYPEKLHARTHYNIHKSPSLYLLLPFYIIHPNAANLIVIQAFALPLGAIGLFLLSRRLLGENCGLVLGLCWSFYVPLEPVILFDFHEIAFFAPFLFLCGWSLLRGDKIAPLIFAMIAAGTKEDAALLSAPAFVLMGIWAKRPKYGWAMGIATVLYFVIATIVLKSPLDENFCARLYGPLGIHDVKDYVKLLLKEPEAVLKVISTQGRCLGFLQTLAPLCFLPLGSIWGVVLAVGPYLTLYPVGRDVYYISGWHYPGLLAPFLFLGVLQKLTTIKQKQRVLWFMVISTAIIQWNFGIMSPNPINVSGEYLPIPTRQGQGGVELEAECDQIVKNDLGPDDPIACERFYASHLSNRTYCYQTTENPKVFSNLAPSIKPKYIIIHKDCPSRFEGYVEKKRYKWLVLYECTDNSSPPKK